MKWLAMMRPGGLLESALIVILACCLSLRLGQDANWDLMNYHLSSPFGLLNGRLAVDLAPVGLQSYLNPLLDLPYYLLSRHVLPDMPRLVTFLAGIPFGLLLIVVLRIARLALPRQGFVSAWF